MVAAAVAIAGAVGNGGCAAVVTGAVVVAMDATTAAGVVPVCRAEICPFRVALSLVAVGPTVMRVGAMRVVFSGPSAVGVGLVVL